MLKFINLKNLTTSTLMGIILAGSLIVESSNNKALAAQGCGNNGHGNNAPISYSEDSGILTIGDYDPGNPGAVKDALIADLAAGNTRTNGNYYITFTGGSGSYSMSIAEATALVNNHPDWEIKGNGANETTTIYECDGNDYDNDGINDAIELGANFNSPPDSDNDGTPDYADDTNNLNLPSSTSDNEVSVELVLSVDVSTSVDSSEYSTQVDGYVAAFENSEVQQAIKDLPKGLAVTMQFWADRNAVDIGWFKLKADANGDISNLDEFIAKMKGVKRTGNYTISGLSEKKSIQVDSNSSAVYMGSGTDLKLAIESATDLVLNNYYQGDDLVIDVSGDGIPDDTPYAEAEATAEYGYKDGDCGYTLNCPPVSDARDVAVAAGITINGLPIIGTETFKTINGVSVSLLENQVDLHYRTHVVGGDSSFVQIASGFDDFETAARLKILREISGVLPSECTSSSECNFADKNHNPIAGNDRGETYINVPVSLDVLANDTDPDGDTTLKITKVIIDDAIGIESGEEYTSGTGKVSFDDNGQITYTNSVADTYTVDYIISDGNGGESLGSVEIKVKASPD